MLPSRPHVALIKALLAIWVIGLTLPRAAGAIGHFIEQTASHRGTTAGTGGAFDALRVGIQGAMESGVTWEGTGCFVAVIAAIVFLCSPVPRIMRPYLCEECK